MKARKSTCQGKRRGRVSPPSHVGLQPTGPRLAKCTSLGPSRPTCHSPLCRSTSAQTLRPAPRSLSGSGTAGPGLGRGLRLGLALPPPVHHSHPGAEATIQEPDALSGEGAGLWKASHPPSHPHPTQPATLPWVSPSPSPTLTLSSAPQTPRILSTHTAHTAAQLVRVVPTREVFSTWWWNGR